MEEKDSANTDKYFKTWCRWSQKTVEDWYEWEVLTDVWQKWSIEWPSPWFLILLLCCRMESEWKRIHPQNLSNAKFIHEFYLANLTSQNSQKVIVLYLRKRRLRILQSFTGLIGRSKVGHILKWLDGESIWAAIEDIAKSGQNFHFTFYWWFNQNFLQILCRAIFDSIVAFYFISIHLHKLQSHFSKVPAICRCSLNGVKFISLTQIYEKNTLRLFFFSFFGVTRQFNVSDLPPVEWWLLFCHGLVKKIKQQKWPWRTV